MNHSILKGCRMTCETFEKSFMPSFKSFSFHRALETAERLINTQNAERINTLLVRAYNAQQQTKRQPIKIKNFMADHLFVTTIECMINDLIAISKNPSEYETKCCDTGLDVFVHKGLLYIVPLTSFINEYKLPSSVEDFSYSPESIGPEWGVRKETWQKLYKNGKMRMEIINASKGIGVEEIKNHFLNPPKPKQQPKPQTNSEQTQELSETQAA